MGCQQVAAGLAHTAVATADGAVYTFGWNADGQLGLGDTVSREGPTLVEGALDDEHITQVRILQGPYTGVRLEMLESDTTHGCPSDMPSMPR